MSRVNFVIFKFDDGRELTIEGSYLQRWELTQHTDDWLEIDLHLVAPSASWTMANDVSEIAPRVIKSPRRRLEPPTDA